MTEEQIYSNIKNACESALSQFIGESPSLEVKRGARRALAALLLQEYSRLSIPDLTVTCDESNNAPGNIEQGCFQATVSVPEAWLTSMGITRDWSPHRLPGYVPDLLSEGYIESDEMMIAKMKAAMGIS